MSCTRSYALRTTRWIASGLLPFAVAALHATPVQAQQPGARNEAELDPATGIEILGPPPPTTPEVVSRDASGGATVRAVRVTEDPTVDGRLDEPFYAATPAISDFIQGLPIEGGAPSELTEAWVAFDDTNVYVAARIWEPAGEDGWIANEMRRDGGQLRQNDSFGVYLDTFYDRRNSIGFFVNPIGGFADLQITNEGSPNMDWNPVAQVRTARFDGGWTLEIAIPFKSIRYRPGREQVWGIQLRRSVLRLNEWNFLTSLPTAVAGGGSNAVFRVSSYGTLVGIEAPQASRNLEVKPYAISGLRWDRTVEPTVSSDPYADVGLDAKYALTQNLTADLTVNTDFAQVEVDEQQVNLTRFSLFFPEKREFFLESRGIFNFGQGASGSGGGGGGAPTLFYSRRIGLQGGEPVSILAGGRVTGKVGAFDVGAVNVQTDGDPSVGAPSTNFTVLRLRRDILSRSSIGALFENRTHSIAADDGSNQAWGLDASFGFGDETSLVGYYAQSRTPGLDGNDGSYQASFAYDADLWGATADHLFVGEDFNPEIGYVRRSGLRQTSASGRYSPRPEIPWIRQITLQANTSYLENDVDQFVESRRFGGRFQLQTERNDSFTANVTSRYENLIESERISGATIPAERYEFTEYQLSLRLGPTRPYQANFSVEWGEYFTGDRLSLGLGQGRLELTPQISLEPSLEFNWIDLPQQEEEGEFDQHVGRLRATWTISPRAYLSGLVQYNSGSERLSANFRIRWEWAPGSEVFLVYTEDRDTHPIGRERWSEMSNRGLVLKVTRLLQL